jgi:hypothetical protein
VKKSNSPWSGSGWFQAITRNNVKVERSINGCRQRSAGNNQHDCQLTQRHTLRLQFNVVHHTANGRFLIFSGYEREEIKKSYYYAENIKILRSIRRWPGSPTKMAICMKDTPRLATIMTPKTMLRELPTISVSLYALTDDSSRTRHARTSIIYGTGNGAAGWASGNALVPALCEVICS